MAPDSGVTGVVGARACLPRAEPCRRVAAAPVVLEVRRALDDRLVTRLRTTRGARFRIPLQPARYMLRVLTSTGRLVSARGVRVRPHAFTLVVLRA